MSIPTRYFTFDSLQRALKEALQEAKLMESKKVYLTQEQVWAIRLILKRAKILAPRRAEIQPDRAPASTKYQGETR